MSSEEQAPADELQRVITQLQRTEANFTAYRKRSRDDAEKARLKGGDEAVSELLGLIDDCDRAVDAISDEPEAGKVLYGIEQLRDRALRHFAVMGYEPVGDVGEAFDPHRHEAVSVEPGAGPDNSILRVHRRGWQRGDELVRVAMVTVLQGSTHEPELEDDKEERLARRRRRRHITPGDYVCPYGIPGCRQDCPGCAPPPPDPFEAALNDDPFARIELETEF